MDTLQCPSTPVKNDLLTAVETPQGTPSKQTAPPGPHELPVVFDGLKLNPTGLLDSPVKLGRPHSTG